VRPDSGTDLAAQLARGSFARQAPLTPIDFSWYAGVHPFGYSLLAPWLIALIGVAVCGLISAVAGAVLLARLLADSARPVLAGVLGAVFSVADVASGRTTFALGAVAALGALLLRSRRPWAALLAVVSALLSPVSAAFLGFAAAVLVLHRRPGGWTLGIASTVPVLVLGVLFPGGGIQPFSTDSAIPAILVGLGLAALTSEPLVRTGALLYAGAVIAFDAHEDPFGSNVLRLGLLISAALVAATVRRNLVLVVVAAMACLSWQVDPVQGDLEASPGPELRALTQALVRLDSKRVEVVAPREHRESWTVAEQVPLARGWGRQIDYRDNPLFYKGTLTGPAFVDWLHRRAVDHVAVPRRATPDFGATREVKLLRKPVAGLSRVWQDRDWTVYAVTDPRPIADAPATVVHSRRTSLTLRSDGPASVHVVLRWSRWLNVTGPGCLERDGNEVRVQFRSAGTVTVGSSLAPAGHC
jgi:hypothetical protein